MGILDTRLSSLSHQGESRVSPSEFDVSVDIDPIFGCHLATGRLDRDGYAFFGRSRAHLVAWERERGAITSGLELDHLCRRRNCVALHHLELVTRAENELRKSWRRRARLTHCPSGHGLASNRIVTPEGGAVCRACNRAAESKRV